jgi:hypothetical protein
MRPRKTQAGREVRVTLSSPVPRPRFEALGVETQVYLACCAAGIATLATGIR